MNNSWARVTSALLGVWLLLSPFLLESSPTQMNNAWVCGVLAIIVSLLALARPPVRFGNTVLGIWVFLSAFMFRGAGEMIWNNAICGALLFALSLARERVPHPGPFSHHRKVPV